MINQQKKKKYSKEGFVEIAELERNLSGENRKKILELIEVSEPDFCAWLDKQEKIIGEPCLDLTDVMIIVYTVEKAILDKLC